MKNIKLFILASVNLYTFSGFTITCPEGYIFIPGNSIAKANDFCVMQFEAKKQVIKKADENIYYRPVSTPEDSPWHKISQIDAKTACKSLGAGYDLISNPEWMTIAWNIESQAKNWSENFLAKGCLYRGNTGIDSTC
ncbi:MAG: hypothetical protein OXB84_01110, partial [Halobacteriovoraceae bacterium]|nr:hypothetical protein [Halobacteriovoraceae bacterium]